MPSMDLYVRGDTIRLNRGTPEEVEFEHGLLPLDPPLLNPPLNRLPAHRLFVSLRCPPSPGALDVVLDTGAYFALFPRHVWRDRFGWVEGRHFESCHLTNAGPFLTSQLLDRSFRVRLVRLTVPVELAGRSGDRLRVNPLIAQLAEPATARDDPKFAILGLFGGVFENRRLAVERPQAADHLTARLEW
jgi:hypothetical protein